MISFILFSILFIFLLSNNFKSISEKEEILISNIITAFILSISIIGIISIGLIFFEKSRIPIFYFAFTSIILYIACGKVGKQNISNFVKSINLIFDIFLSNFKNIKFIIFLIFWLYFISFGPINHPDTITTYVGYPYQFFLNNKHFIDGGLHQGVLGLCDFANLSFIQENNIWFIRSMQSLPIVLIVSIFLLRNTNRYLIIAFLTCPVFIQWLTIGKYLFLPDIGITITYLVWVKYKNRNTFLNLITIVLLSISFKITCIIISIPIGLHLVFEFFKNKQFFKHQSRLEFSRVFFFIFSILSLLTIFTYRAYVTGNPFYPVLNNYFIADNQQIIDFENFLRGFMRGGGYPFNLFLTNDINSLGMIIGPATGFFLLSIPLSNILPFKKKYLSISELVPICQIILLLTFSQGRADYFLSPIILIFIAKNNIMKELFASNNFFIFKIFTFKFISQSLLIIQLSIFLSITLISGYQTIYSTLDYESYMNRYAFNYELTNTLNNYAKEPLMNLGNRTALLFLNKDYIHEDRFKKCMNYDGKNNSTFYCIDTLKVNSVISYGDQLNNDQFKCAEYFAKSTSRNPFNLKKRIFHICNKIER